MDRGHHHKRSQPVTGQHHHCCSERRHPTGGKEGPQDLVVRGGARGGERTDQLLARARIDPAAGDEWRRAEKTTKYVITKARQDSWRNFASGLSLRTDVTKLWKTIHSIDGRTPATRRDDAYLLGKKTPSRDSNKGDAFVRT